MYYWTSCWITWLVSVWFPVAPEPALAPVMPPVMFNCLAKATAVQTCSQTGYSVLFQLQIPAVLDASYHVGFDGYRYGVSIPDTWTSSPVGVTMYTTEPAGWITWIGKCLIDCCTPVLAPVMPPVIVPIVQLCCSAVLAVKLIFGPVPLQILAVLWCSYYRFWISFVTVVE
jgi:hypothetical protein